MHDAVEGVVADHFGRHHAVLTGSGATAIHTVLKALDAGRVFFPDLTCEAALNGALLLDREVSLLDVDLTSGLLGHDVSLPLDAAPALPGATSGDDTVQEGPPRQDVLVATHLYGNLVDVEGLRSTLPSRVFVLEDAAQGYGGVLRGETAGALGDASVVSFGPGKALDCGGGGAILTDDAEMAKVCRRYVATLPANPATRSHAREAMQRGWLAIAREPGRSEADHFAARTRLKRDHPAAFAFQADPAVADRIKHAVSEATHRYEKLREQHEKLLDVLRGVPSLVPLLGPGNPVPWRTSVVATARDAVFAALIGAGFEVSRLFAPLHRSAGLPDTLFPNASRIASGVINFRLNSRISLPTLDRCLGQLEAAIHLATP